MPTNCSFAQAGTYGHECGQPATKVVVLRSVKTRCGFFFGRRCDKHATTKGGENAGALRVETFNAEAHRNIWK